jgi:formamidopyrimidine-DNA glycosylase
MGPEPLGPGLTPGHLRQAFAGRRQAIKLLLLDQRIVAGLGNIYVCEALFRARIDPRKAAGAVSRPALERLVPAIRDVLEQAIGDGGSTLRDYARPDGELGYFATRFAVYGREGQPCGREDGGAIARIVQGGRSTWFCPRCQK